MSMKKRRTYLRAVELIALLAIVVVGGLLALPLLRDARTEITARTCQENLHRWASVFSLYASENGWYYPPVNGFEPVWASAAIYKCANVHDDFDFCPRLSAIFPDYTTDLGILVCPDSAYMKSPMAFGALTLRGWRVDAQALGVVQAEQGGRCPYAGAISNGDLSYTYFGWRLDKANDANLCLDEARARELGLPATGSAQIAAVLAWLDPRRHLGGGAPGPPRDPLDNRVALREIIREGGLPYEEVASGEGGGEAGIDRLWVGRAFDAWNPDGAKNDGLGREVQPWHAKMPVLWDTIGRNAAGDPEFVHREPPGVNVLFLDGHVDFRKYPGEFPVSKAFATMTRAE